MVQSEIDDIILNYLQNISLERNLINVKSGFYTEKYLKWLGKKIQSVYRRAKQQRLFNLSLYRILYIYTVGSVIIVRAALN